MTKIAFKTHADPLVYTPDLHVLTYAEEGFSPLDIHGRRLEVSRSILSKFSLAVNLTKETGTLHPTAPISAVPRDCIRDIEDVDLVVGHFLDFVKANTLYLSTPRLLLDFSTPSLPRHVYEAILQVFGAGTQSGIAEILVIRN